jgi:hypothetical protein
MIKEYDVVKAAKNINEIVSIGCIGAVVMVFDKPTIAYEVEFFNDANETIAVLTVKPDEIVSR